MTFFAATPLSDGMNDVCETSCCSFRQRRVGNVFVIAWTTNFVNLLRRGNPSNSRHLNKNLDASSPHVTVGPDWRILLFSVMLLTFPAAVFVSITSLSLARSMCIVLFLGVSLFALFRAAFTDPGVLPPQPFQADREAPPMIVRELCVLSNGASLVVERRWCTACNLYRPVRTVHCRFCNVCIQRRDHHCPWTGTCVGARNYRFYFLFIWATLLCAVIMCVGSATDFSVRWKRCREVPLDVDDGGLPHARSWMQLIGCSMWSTRLLEPFLFVLSTGALVLLGSLCWRHVGLIAKEMTTTEEVRHAYGYSVSPFSHGSWWKNARVLLWGPMPQSMFGVDSLPLLNTLLQVQPATPASALVKSSSFSEHAAEEVTEGDARHVPVDAAVLEQFAADEAEYFKDGNLTKTEPVPAS